MPFEEGSMQQADVLTTLFSHHLWANLCLLDCCTALNDEQLQARIPGSYGSIRETLEHFVKSERNYFSRISTGQRYDHPDAELPLSWAEMRESLRATGTGLIGWASRVQASDSVTVDWEGTPRAVPKAILLTQVINHATEHREQIKAILTELGIEPPDLQGWAYFDAIDA
jgi:uncharacterized damage-inducible protein DinB